MTNEKYIDVNKVDDNTYKVKIGNEGCYVLHTLRTEAQALHFIVTHAEPYSKLTYNDEQIEHVFNNALTHMWDAQVSDGEQYSLGRCEQIVKESTSVFPEQLELFNNDVYKKKPLGACSTSYVGTPDDYSNRQQEKALGEKDTLDYLLK